MEISAVVRAAEIAHTALIACGGGTQWQTGYPPRPEQPYLVLRTDRLNRVTDYQPDDLTVTCEPGVTLAQLQETLVTRNQWLPLDVPYGERATLGGIVSTNANGFGRPAYGTPRDLLIGVRAVMTGGQEIKGGGKVVKNVAGYDVCKLFTGAWGTLGILTELTFKVRPFSEATRTLAWNVPDMATGAKIGFDLHSAQLAPMFLLVTNEPNGTPRLIVGLEGYTVRVHWQATEFARRVASAGIASAPSDVSASELTALRDRQARLEPDIAAAIRIAVPPADLPELVARLQAIPNLAFTAHAETGIVSLAAPQSDATSGSDSPVNAIRRAMPLDANIVWTRIAPQQAAGENVPVWGETRPDFALHRALKMALDPQETFSPGRFLGKL